MHLFSTILEINLLIKFNHVQTFDSPVTQSVKENTLVKAKRLTRSSTIDPSKKDAKKEAKIEILEKDSVTSPIVDTTPDFNRLKKKVRKANFLIRTRTLYFISCNF